MLKEPTTVNTRNFALLSGGKFHKTRRGKIKAVTVHITAGLQNLNMKPGTDYSAENTNKWALNSGVEASWARISDSDGVIFCLPYKYVAWQAKGYNTNTVGNEICKTDTSWGQMTEEWTKWTIWYAALAIADIVVAERIPLRRCTKAELDRAIANDTAPVGFIEHSKLSTIRSDPGASFPWELYFGYIRAIITGSTHPDGKQEEEFDMDLNTPVDVRDPKTNEIIQIPFKTLLNRMDWTYQETLRQRETLATIVANQAAQTKAQEAVLAAIQKGDNGSVNVDLEAVSKAATEAAVAAVKGLKFTVQEDV